MRLDRITAQRARFLDTIFEEPPITGLHISINVVLGMVCLVGRVLCALFLYTVRRARGSELGSRWCLCHVIAIYVAVSAMQLFGVVIYFGRLFFRTDTLFYKCIVRTIQISMSLWSTLPSMLSLLVLALDQFISVLFPLQTRVKSGETAKKVMFSLGIWGPSAGFIIAVFVVFWLASGDVSCASVMSALADVGASYTSSIITCVCVNLIVYGALVCKIIFYMARNRFRQRNLNEVFRKQRRLLVIFCFVCLTSILLWMPPFVFLSFTELCLSVDFCRVWRQDIWLMLATLYQGISVFDPLFLAWRFPAIGDLYFCRQRASQSRGGT